MIAFFFTRLFTRMFHRTKWRDWTFVDFRRMAFGASYRIRFFLRCVESDTSTYSTTRCN